MTRLFTVVTITDRYCSFARAIFMPMWVALNPTFHKTGGRRAC